MSESLFIRALNLCQNTNLSQGRGDNSEAIRCYKKALVIFRELKLESHILTCLSNLGLLMESAQSYERALKYFKQALDNENLPEQSLEKAIVLYNIGRIFVKMRNYKETLAFLKSSVDIFSVVQLQKDLSYLKREAELHLLNVRSVMNKKSHFSI